MSTADADVDDTVDAAGTLDDAEIVRRLREAGARGGRTSAARKRERRRRYLDGEMGRVERVEYERWVEANRVAGRKGGWPSHRRNRAVVAEARGEITTDGFDDDRPGGEE